MNESEIEAEAMVPEPGGWLAEYQRAHCAGGSAMSTYQGLICDEIVLPKGAADSNDANVLVNAAAAYAEAIQSQACYLPGEFAPEALWSYHVSDYLKQASEGGHAQYIANRGADVVALRSVSSALKSMLADPHYEIFTTLLAVSTGAPRTVRKALAQNNYRNVAAALKALDKKLAEVEREEPLTPRHKTWLRSLRKLKLAPDNEMTQNLQRIAAANPLRVRRWEEMQRVRQQQEADDPMFRTVKALCDMASLQFAGIGPRGTAPMRSVWPEGPDRNAFVCRVMTDRGERAALFYTEGGLFKRRLAVLMEQGGSLPAGSLTLARGDYEAIVPAAQK